MRIYSWNMLFRNQEQDRAFEFIKGLDFDVFALQEVPEPFLARLRELPYYLACDIDWDRMSPKEPVRHFLVILSKQEIVNQGSIALPDYFYPLRTTVFMWFLKVFHFAKLANRHSFYVDVRRPASGATMRVFNLHLTLANPRLRRAEFDEAMMHLDDSPAIVCGDFNIIESYRVSALSWIFAGRLSDALNPKRERQAMEAHFAANGLANPFKGEDTHAFARSQLDHILIPENAPIYEARVEEKRFGSDHHPVFVRTEV